MSRIVFNDVVVKCLLPVPASSPSRGEDVTVYVLDMKQPSLPPLLFFFYFFYSVLVSVSVFMTLSTVFHSINSHYSSPLSHSVLLVFISASLVLSAIYIYIYI